MTAAAPLLRDGLSAETALRNALAVVAAEESEVEAIVVVLRAGCIPQLFWSSVDQAGASMAALRVQMFAADVMRERMEEGGY